MSDRIFLDATSGMPCERPIGIVDIFQKAVCRSVKAAQNGNPHWAAESARLISGRNSPIYSSDIVGPARTGPPVLDIHNDRIETATQDYNDHRSLVLIPDMQTRDFPIFERLTTPPVVHRCRWDVNNNSKPIRFENGEPVFVWKPHGSQFTIREPILSGATRFFSPCWSQRSMEPCGARMWCAVQRSLGR